MGGDGRWPRHSRMSLKIAGFLLIALLPLLLLQPVAANSNFSDDFNGPALNTNLWTFINPLSDSTISMTGSQASIAVPGSSAHYTGSGINTAPRIMQSSTNGDFEIEVKFDTAVGSGRLQGVRIEADLNNSLTVQFQNTGSGQTIAYIHVVNGIADTPVSTPIPTGAPLYLRVLRQGNQWTLSHTKSLASWTTAFQFERVMNVTSVGVLAGNLPSTRVPANTVRVDYFYKRTPPVIEQQPANVTVSQPNAASFTVVASGTTPLSYQWRRNGVNISGATNATYILSPTSTADSGAQFDVIVSNAYGSVTSQTATLTVNGSQNTPPSITQQPANVTVTAPDAASFSVVATGSTPLSYQWRRNGANIPGATAATYVLSPTATTDSGDQFNVIVTNAFGSVTSQTATLTVNPPGTGGGQELVPGADSLIEYGIATAIDGNTLVIGSNKHDGSNTYVGAAYVFIRQGSSWQLQAKLEPNVKRRNQFFGWSVDMMGDTVVVGAPGDKSTGTNAGAAYVFTRSGTTWTQQAKILPADLTANDGFGIDVSVDSDSLAAGAYNEGPSSAGAAYVFTRSGTNWSQQAKLTAADGGASQTFGFAVALQGNTLVVGANGYENSSGFAGAAYVFQRSGSTWTQQQKLTPDASSNGLIGFGVSVAIDGNSIAVGSHGDDQMGNNAGAAYKYGWNGSTWAQQSKLFSLNTAAGQEFGVHVSVSGNTVVVGANSGKFNAMMDGLPGSAYAFE